MSIKYNKNKLDYNPHKTGPVYIEFNVCVVSKY